MEVISRKDALASGAKYYFTGKPCSEGGVGLRLVSNGRCYCAMCIAKIKNQKAVDYQLHRVQRDSTSSLWKKLNPEKVRESEKKSRKKNSTSKKVECVQRGRPRIEGTYYERNKEKIKAKRKTPEVRNQLLLSKRKYKAVNKDKVRAESSTRRARRRQAVPSWYGELDNLVLSEATSLCVQREHETGTPWHVDHMVPLSAKNVCGLHCADNLQVIPSAMNLAKGNKLWYTVRYEWLK